MKSEVLRCDGMLIEVPWTMSPAVMIWMRGNFLPSPGPRPGGPQWHRDTAAEPPGYSPESVSVTVIVVASGALLFAASKVAWVSASKCGPNMYPL